MLNGSRMELDVVIASEQDGSDKAGLLGLVSCRLSFLTPTFEPTFATTSELTAKGFKKPGRQEFRLVDGDVEEIG